MSIPPVDTAPITRVASAPAARAPAARAPAAHLIGIGTAVPDAVWSQTVVEERLASLWQLNGDALNRWRRIIAGSQVDTRHAVLPAEDVMTMSTHQRMESYAALAPSLAADAAAASLRAADRRVDEVTDLIVVSCTGFSAPGVDVELVRRLGLRPGTRRTIIGFMGCFGGIIGLRTADHACRADPNAVALVVCVELCSLHVRDDRDPQNMVAAALFGDGAAAAVVAGDGAEANRAAGDRMPRASPLGTLGVSQSHLLANGRDWMTWTITDAGFAMTLTRDVPVALRRHLAHVLAHADTAADSHDDAANPLYAPGRDIRRARSLAVHPGGPGILDAVRSALPDASPSDLDVAASVLRSIGNVSSGTILFVLRALLERGQPLPALLLAFGPGLSIETLRLERFKR